VMRTMSMILLINVPPKLPTVVTPVVQIIVKWCTPIVTALGDMKIINGVVVPNLKPKLNLNTKK